MHNVSERQLEWGRPFPGQIRLVCQDCLEETMEVVATHTHTHSKQATHDTHAERTHNRLSAVDVGK